MGCAFAPKEPAVGGGPPYGLEVPVGGGVERGGAAAEEVGGGAQPRRQRRQALACPATQPQPTATEHMSAAVLVERRRSSVFVLRWVGRTPDGLCPLVRVDAACLGAGGVSVPEQVGQCAVEWEGQRRGERGLRDPGVILRHAPADTTAEAQAQNVYAHKRPEVAKTRRQKVSRCAEKVFVVWARGQGVGGLRAKPRRAWRG